ncbi:MaoC family dehydratase N-terminal domain-containing protein [Cytobacillus kochii]|uniref:MaoC family dehydratase N-terminal domain-containing protein n=1 Tax=Cytobacillus kochii TaxID=859143 RepID=UPI0025A01316|nr:MaoC family dehydratase N-terminal domain-containing protein [Cytobacillus kochii]MDM5209184.1 MaoC family dehydratase N-terminal domain-containing protein [Cytobacillus kochii]
MLDQTIIGKTGPTFMFEVDKRHVKQFAQAIGDDNPLYTEPTYADQSPYNGLIAPPTFPVVAGVEGEGIELDLDKKRMLHGEQSFIYHRPLKVGESLTCQIKVADLYEKEGKKGKMQFIILDTEMRDTEGDLVVTSRMNIIYPQPPVQAV